MNCLMCSEPMATKPRTYCRSCNTCNICGEQLGSRGVMASGPLTHIECAARLEAETKRAERIARLRGKGILR